MMPDKTVWCFLSEVCGPDNCRAAFITWYPTEDGPEASLEYWRGQIVYGDQS